MDRRTLFGSLGAGLAGLAAVTGFGPRASGQDRGRPDPGDRESGRRALVPTRLFLTTGKGVHEWDRRANDLALYNAGIGNYNRDHVSSIVPPGCKVIPREEGVKLLKEGEILFTVLPLVESNRPGTRVVSSVGLAIPEDGATGTIAEVYEEDSDVQTAEQGTRRALEWALGMLAFRMNVDFDPREEYRPGKEVYRIGGKAVRVHSASEAATVDPSGKHTAVVASAVLLL